MQNGDAEGNKISFIPMFYFLDAVSYTHLDVYKRQVLELCGLFQNARLVHGDGQDDDLHGRDLRRQDEAVIVAVGHDDCADHTRGGAPGGLRCV